MMLSKFWGMLGLSTIIGASQPTTVPIHQDDQKMAVVQVATATVSHDEKAVSLKDAKKDDDETSLSTLPGGANDAEFATLLRLPSGEIAYFISYGSQVAILDCGGQALFKQDFSVLSGRYFLPMAVALNKNRVVAVVHNSNLIKGDQELWILDRSLGTRAPMLRESAMRAYAIKGLERIAALTTCPNGLLISGSVSGKIVVWDMDKYSRQKGLRPGGVYKGFTTEIEELLCSLTALSDENIVYGLYDGTIKIVNLVTGRRKVIGRKHAKAITALVTISETMFAAGSEDATISLWRKEENGAWGCFNILEGHKAGIVSLAMNKNGELVSLAKDGDIKVWGY
jgi:WD40 repeat protein